tara:strand:+ start:60 stop:797 length:738 start_codon:yes stop_codon:yes gene_type:complete
MKLYLSFIALAFWTVNTYGQDCEEFKKHYNSIDSTYHPGQIIDRIDTVFNANKAFVDYTIEHLLEKSADSCFISNRNLLKQLNLVSCDSSKVVIEDRLKNGKTCKINVSTREFQVSEHSIKANEDSTSIDKIDGQYPFGGQYGVPKVEIGLIEIEIDGEKLKIPRKAYGNFFYPIMCDNYRFARQIEAYESLDGEFIYLYIYGGNAAGTYFSKLIFDHKEYKTKIASDYYPLSIHSSFRQTFIGF